MLRLHTRAVLLIIVAAVVFPATAQEHPPGILTIRDGRDSTSVASVDSAGIRFLDLQDLLRFLQLPALLNDTTRKVEFLCGLNLVRLTHRNPFAVITERASNTIDVFQLSANAVRRGGRFFLPVDAVIDLFDHAWTGSLSWDTARSQLNVRSIRRSPYDVTGLQVERRVNGYLLTVQATRPLEDVEAWLKPDGWLFVTLAGARADTLALQTFKPTGGIRSLLVFQSPTAVQLTFQVSTDIEQAELVRDPGSANLLLALRTRSTIPAEKIPRRSSQTVQRDLAKERRRWKLDVIVIDAGHGGKDPGALGVAKTREKDITLAVALRLGRLIEQSMRDVHVVYTRKSDKFVELYRRTQIANEAGGKLFISVHCNSLDRKPSRPNGFEIYLLRPGKTEDAMAIAARENAVIKFEQGYEERYKKLTEEEFIIVTMAQSAYMRYSEQFAEAASASMAKQKIRNSGVKQAGFYVLVGASMPNVLVELGYLSNKNEEQMLRSAKGQEHIADALFRGIKAYKEKYEETLED